MEIESIKKANSGGTKNFSDWVVFFKKLINYILESWRIIILFVLIGCLIGYWTAVTSRNKYIATLTFTMEDEKGGGVSGGLGGALGLASSLGLDLGTGAGGAFTGLNLVELMKSRTITERVLSTKVKYLDKEINLAELYYMMNINDLEKIKKNHHILQEISKFDDIPRGNFSRLQDSLIGIFHKEIINDYLEVYQKDKKISIITIKMQSFNEIFSKNFVDNLVKEVSDFYISTKSKKAKNNVEILERQVDSIRNQLNEAISGVASATDNVYNLNDAFSRMRTPSSKKQIDVQANTAILTQLVINLELARVTLRKETPLIQIIDKPSFPLYKEEIKPFRRTMVVGLLFSVLTVVFLVLFFMLKDTFKLSTYNDQQ